LVIFGAIGAFIWSEEALERHVYFCRRPSVKIWHGKREIPVARARVSKTGESNGFTTLTSRAVGAVLSALGVGGCGCGIFVLASRSFQLAEVGSASILPLQEKNDSADTQQRSITSFM
jgi:hypothetical protein